MKSASEGGGIAAGNLERGKKKRDRFLSWSSEGGVRSSPSSSSQPTSANFGRCDDSEHQSET